VKFWSVFRGLGLGSISDLGSGSDSKLGFSSCSGSGSGSGSGTVQGLYFRFWVQIQVLFGVSVLGIFFGSGSGSFLI